MGDFTAINLSETLSIAYEYKMLIAKKIKQIGFFSENDEDSKKNSLVDLNLYSLGRKLKPTINGYGKKRNSFHD